MCTNFPFSIISGNENIYRLSQDGTHELSIVLVDWEGNLMEANYSKFAVKSEEDNYSLSVSGYSGNAGLINLLRSLKKYCQYS